MLFILGMMQANDMRPRTAGTRPKSAGKTIRSTGIVSV